MQELHISHKADVIGVGNECKISTQNLYYPNVHQHDILKVYDILTPFHCVGNVCKINTQNLYCANVHQRDILKVYDILPPFHHYTCYMNLLCKKLLGLLLLTLYVGEPWLTLYIMPLLLIYKLFSRCLQQSDTKD